MTTTSIPTRHPDAPRPLPIPILVFNLLTGMRQPSELEFRRLGELLTEGDAPMDELVAWMHAAGTRDARRMFERALAGGIDSVPDAPAPLVSFFTAVEQLPDWVDPELLRRGALVMRRGGADGLYLARDVSLQGGYLFSGFNQTLLRTGALEKGSNQRFAETTRWALDVISPDGILPGGVGFRSTIRVRLIHGFVRRHVAAMPDWRADQWGLPVNQTDMAATLVGSFIAPVAAGLGAGMVNRPSDLDAVAHLARYVGWLLGVRDDYLPRSFRDGIRILNHTSCALSRPDATSKQLAMPMAQDPLSWSYRRFPTLRRRIARSQHLSVASAFLGPRAMRALGLPPYVVPWYPAVRLPANLLRSLLAQLPGGLERGAARGDREHARFLRTIGAEDATIGASASHLARAS